MPLRWSQGILNGRVPYGTGDLSEIRSLVYSSVGHVREIVSPLKAGSPPGSTWLPKGQSACPLRLGVNSASVSYDYWYILLQGYMVQPKKGRAF